MSSRIIAVILFLLPSIGLSQDTYGTLIKWYQSPGLTDSARVAANYNNKSNKDTTGYCVGTATIRTSIFEIGPVATIVATLEDTSASDSASGSLELWGAIKNQFEKDAPADSKFRLVDTKTGITETSLVWNLHASAYPVFTHWYLKFIGDGDNKKASATKVRIDIGTQRME